MSLLAQVKAGLDAGWEALDDLKVEVDFVHIVRGTLNPATGAITQTRTTVRTLAALVEFKDTQRANSDIQAGDMQAIMRASDLPFRPSDEDQLIEVSDGTLWTVKVVKGDKRLYWDMQVRR